MKCCRLVVYVASLISNVAIIILLFQNKKKM